MTEQGVSGRDRHGGGGFGGALRPWAPDVLMLVSGRRVSCVPEVAVTGEDSGKSRGGPATVKGCPWGWPGVPKGSWACWYLPGVCPSQCDLLPTVHTGITVLSGGRCKIKTFACTSQESNLGEIFGFFKEFRISNLENHSNTAKPVFTILEIETKLEIIAFHGKKLLFSYEASDNPVIGEEGLFKFFFLRVEDTALETGI